MTKPAYIDIGVNLADKSFERDLDAVLQRAQAAGVSAMVATGTNAERSLASADLAAAHRGFIYATAGVHPHEAKSADASTWETIAELCQRPEVVAVGECGLDFNRDFSPRPIQRSVLEKQLELAETLGLPVFLHERDAADTLIDVLKACGDSRPKTVVHCFTADQASLEGYLELDLYIGITGWICDERRGHHLHPLIGLIPDDRLMLETDAPYLLPRTIKPRPKSRRNEPALITYVAETVAECLGTTVEQVARQTSATAREFFALGASISDSKNNIATRLGPTAIGVTMPADEMRYPNLP